MVFIAQGYSPNSDIKHRKRNSVVTEEKMGPYNTVNSLSVFVNRKYTESANQSQFGGDLEQIHMFLLNSKKRHPREQIALEQ